MKDYYDQIDIYLNDGMDAAQKAEFEAALASDADLQVAIKRHQGLIEELHGMRLRENIRKNMVRPAPAASPNNLRWIVLAGILIMSAIAVYYWQSRQESATPAPESEAPKPAPTEPIANQTPTPTPPQTPANTPVPPTQKPAEPADAKTLELYAEAVAQLEDLDYALMGDEKKDAALEKQLNQAIGLLKSGKAKAAIPLLEQVKANRNTFYQDDADWLLALAWLPNDPAKSKAQMQAISQNAAHPYRINALQLLKKMK
jgi:hypothetical protein